jgi:hypothetical protein
MRTTLRLDEDLMGQAKALAARQRRTLTSVVEEAIRRLLHDSSQPERRGRVDLPISGARGGPQPGVDLDDSATLLDRMDDTGAAG